MSVLDGTGVWSAPLRYGDAGEAAESAAALEEMGFSAVWIPDVGGDLFGRVELLLGATTRLVVATGILNLWMHEAADTARWRADLGARFLVGIGVSHSVLIDAKSPGRYQRPLEAMRTYLDDLDASDPPLAPADRILAALGPRMLELARDRAAGAHPYLANPEHTRFARGVLGAGPLLAPEQPVVLSADAAAARRIARGHLSGYLALPNYTNNLRRLGWSDDDFADGGSDRLVDGIVGWGAEEAIAARVQAHRDAGADHVCVQLLTDEPGSFGLESWRRLAAALI
ncbi:MAG: TIGR03620 family F420-dependent LLM class oxidoreductase [Acidimicrobiales bacterium]